MRSFVVSLALVAATALAACGGPDDANDLMGAAPSSSATAVTLDGVSIEPSSASLKIVNGTIVTRGFGGVMHYSDGSTAAIGSDASWSVDAADIGSIDASGVFTPTGQRGGAVTVTLTSGASTATALLTVKLHDVLIPAHPNEAVIDAIRSANQADSAVSLSYPYDGTVFPRGLGPARVMWQNGAPSDFYYAHFVSTFAELEVFSAPVGRSMMGAEEWTKFESSTPDNIVVDVNRWDGKNATRIGHQTWTLASTTLPGVIYYWEKERFSLMRLRPGDTVPEDFTSGIVPPADGSCTMKCHAVSANGKVLVGAGGTFGGSYDLSANATRFELPAASNRQWGLPAISPDGTYVVVNAIANQFPDATLLSGMFRASDGTSVSNSGLPGESMFMPAFSPDAHSLVYVGDTLGAPLAISTTTPGNLRALDFDANATPMFSNPRDVIVAGADEANPLIAWPTVSPDGKLVAYARLSERDPTKTNNLSSLGISPEDSALDAQGDFYIANLADGTGEIPLANLNGDAMFAGDARNTRRNFEPNFAPVAAGGYFWVVFHSRRTFGSALTGAPEDTKQLWVAAIDPSLVPGRDPSHPAFHLPGQSEQSLNQRGVFAAMP